MGEQDRPVGHLDPAGRLPRDRECRGGEIARFREVGPKMRAAGILAPKRRERNNTADLAQRAQIDPVMPGQIEAAVGVGDADREKFRFDRIHRREAAFNAGAVAHHPDVGPTSCRGVFRATR